MSISVEMQPTDDGLLTLSFCKPAVAEAGMVTVNVVQTSVVVVGPVSGVQSEATALSVAVPSLTVGSAVPMRRKSCPVMVKGTPTTLGQTMSDDSCVIAGGGTTVSLTLCSL